MSSGGRSAAPPDRADSSLFVPPSTSLIHPNDAAKAQMASRGIDGLRHARRRTVAAAIVRKGKGDTLLFASVSGTSSRSHVLLRCRVPSLSAEPILAAMDFAQYSATREQMFVLLNRESLKSPCHNDRYFHNADDTAAHGTSKATASISPDTIPIWPEPKMKVIRHDAIGATDIRLGLVAQPVSRRWPRAF